MERVDAAGFAEKVSCGMGVKLIFGQTVFTLNKLKFTFMDFNHESIFSDANSAVTGSQLWRVCDDFELHVTAVAAA